MAAGSEGEEMGGDRVSSWVATTTAAAVQPVEQPRERDRERECREGRGAELSSLEDVVRR